MYKQVFALLLVTSALFACSPEGDVSSFSKELTYKVTDENAKDTVDATLNTVDLAEDADLSDLPTNGQTALSLIRSVQARETESVDGACPSSGSVSYSMNYDDLQSAEGSFTGLIEADNCRDSESTVDGSASLTLSWTENAESISLTAEFEEFSVDYEEGAFRVDGNLAMTGSAESFEFSWDLYIAAPEFDNQMVHTYTTINIQGNYADEFLTAGAWRIDGAEGSYAEFKVVSNGIEASVNGGQAVLFEWE